MGSWLPSVIASALAFGAAYLAYRQSTKATAARASVDKTRVDAEAYRVAQGFYSDLLSRLETQVQTLRQQIDREREVADRLRTRVNELEETLAKLRYQLILAGFPDQSRDDGLLPPGQSQS